MYNFKINSNSIIMKKLLVIACVFVASFSYAQDLKFGVKGGLNLSNLVGDDVENTDIRTGIYLGGFLNKPLNDHLSFQPELIFSMQGAKGEDGFSNNDLTFKLSYLNVPLLLKLQLGSTDKVHLFAGPQLGFVLKSEIEQEQGDMSGAQDVKDQTNGVDFGLNFGLSFVVSDNMSLDVRYNRGLSKIFEEGGKSYNSVIQLGASYSF